MRIEVKRLFKGDTYTIGKMYLDGKYFCDTLEDKDRGLTQAQDFSVIKAKKVYGETAIPSGTYKVECTYSQRFGRILPLLFNVKGFDGIRIHRGNTSKDTLGCILVGENKVKGQVVNSAITEVKLMDILRNEKDITITIG